MMINRRTFLRGVGAAVATAPMWARAAKARAATTKSTPRHWVFIFLSGGIDAVFTTDPKTRKEVESWVDVPYRPQKIIEQGDVSVGPLFAPFRPVLGRCSIVNGVRVSTANHNSGWTQFWRMTTNTTDDMPSIQFRIGTMRPEDLPMGDLPSHWLNGRMDSILTATDGAEVGELRDALDFHSRQSGIDPMMAAGYREAARTYERIASAPNLKFDEWTPVEGPFDEKAYQRALWFLENDVSSCITIAPAAPIQPWDTHIDSNRRQTISSGYFFPLVSRFLQELETRRSVHGKLSEITNVVIGSELGRFPMINKLKGKDHFPEAPLIFMGPSFNDHDGKGAQFGKTGTRMETLPIDYSTGQARKGGDLLLLDDVGTTLLNLAGVEDPAVYGYTGRNLDFLIS